MGYVVCGNCSARIPPTGWNQEIALPCPLCARPVGVIVFPEALRTRPPAIPEPVVTGEDAGCFDHPGNRAVAACEQCGRFVCAVCDIEAAGGHVCPSCFDRSLAPALVERVNFDTIALALVTAPMLFCWVPILTTPIAVYLALRHWNDPSLVFPRSRWRLWLTLAIAALQLAAVLLFVVYVLPMARSKP